ncbi:hypothetical protein [Streptomyces longisporus]|uniref:Uncharacterized protein n=1 Tax=Streptomyces longisporus TaxID=1948 RepID=A0ABN3MGC8_STRLO
MAADLRGKAPCHRLLRQCRDATLVVGLGKGTALIIRGVLGLLLLLAVSVCTAVACGYRGIDVWVWDWADVVVTRRTRYGTPWRSLATMRIYFGVMGIFFLAGGLHTLAG